MSKISGKLKWLARLRKGRTISNHRCEKAAKMLGLPFVPTPQELDEALEAAAQRRAQEQAEIRKAREEGRIFQADDLDIADKIRVMKGAQDG